MQKECQKILPDPFASSFQNIPPRRCIMFGSVITTICNVIIGMSLSPQDAADLKPVPGAVVAHSPAKTKQYIGSPSIAVLPNGHYVVSHDFFGPGSTRDVTQVFASADQGKTWAKRATISGQWWSTLFVHNNTLYLMGVTKEYGFAVIRKSTDAGKTWTDPKDADSGLLHDKGMYHCAPVPVVVHNGRLWRAMEEYLGPKWGSFSSFMMSAPVDADLLKASSWTSSNRLPRNTDWLGKKFGGWLEGNAVVAPDGSIVNVLRVDFQAHPEKAAIVRISADGKTSTFDPEKDFIDFPGGCKKFTIRYDAKSRKYWTLANFVPVEFQTENVGRARNTLALCCSSDLKTWDVRKTILQHADTKTHGFQYVDWLFAGDDLIAAVRTAFDEPDGTQAHNSHDSNYLTFHRIAGFRNAK